MSISCLRPHCRGSAATAPFFNPTNYGSEMRSFIVTGGSHLDVKASLFQSFRSPISMLPSSTNDAEQLFFLGMEPIKLKGSVPKNRSNYTGVDRLWESKFYTSFQPHKWASNKSNSSVTSSCASAESSGHKVGTLATLSPL